MSIKNDLMMQITSFKSSIINNEPMAVQPVLILLNVVLDIIEKSSEKNLSESIQKAQKDIENLNRIIDGKNIIIPKTDYIQ